MTTSSWQTTHWTDGLSQELIDAIEYECLRQHVSEAHRGYLREAWEVAEKLAQANEAPTLEDYCYLAGLLEPSNKGKLRTTPVTFAHGGFAVAPGAVEPAIRQLLRFWPGVEASHAEKLYWVRESLVVHSFTDGNGRLAFIMHNWLQDSWAAPRQLPYFDFEH